MGKGNRTTTRSPEEKGRTGWFSSVELVMLGKDFRSILSVPANRVLLALIPALLAIGLPIVCFAVIQLLPASAPKGLSAFTGEEESRQVWASVFSSMVCPLLYLSIPVLCSVTCGSCVFMGERENRTLESLFLSAVHPKTIFNEKTKACVLLSLFISLLAYMALFLTISIADIILSVPFFFSLEWLSIGLFLGPALILFSVVLVSLVLPNVYSALEAQQITGYILLPLVIIYLLQLSGTIRVRAWLLILLSVLLIIISVILFNLASRRFQAELLRYRDASGRPLQ